MSGRNVLQIGMYLSGNMGGSHFFYILRMLRYLVYLFVCCFVIDFCGVTASSFYIFYTFSMFIIFQLKAISSCSNTQKAVSNLQMSNSKACHRRFNAKSNVYRMNNIRVPETFLISVCYQICFSAVRVCCGSKPREMLTAVEADFF